jgi:hypothetical protein
MLPRGAGSSAKEAVSHAFSLAINASRRIRPKVRVTNRPDSRRGVTASVESVTPWK